MATDIEYAIKRMRNIVIKSRAKMKNNLALALMELPSANQIRRLKKAANEMDKVHKVVMRLAAARESTGERQKNKGKIPIKYILNATTMDLNARMVNGSFRPKTFPDIK
ncbi:hypothetical protein KJ866_04180 [Patescibacteria group bacterium]|nr:hypothetical protein [Patescibacteria group bacterium]MBU2220268.1 hypothetical protein [Patescibacteria group bacterium]